MWWWWNIWDYVWTDSTKVISVRWRLCTECSHHVVTITSSYSFCYSQIIYCSNWSNLFDKVSSQNYSFGYNITKLHYSTSCSIDLMLLTLYFWKTTSTEQDNTQFWHTSPSIAFKRLARLPLIQNVRSSVSVCANGNFMAFVSISEKVSAQWFNTGHRSFEFPFKFITQVHYFTR
jgi:hypothetical protein